MHGNPFTLNRLQCLEKKSKPLTVYRRNVYLLSPTAVRDIPHFPMYAIRGGSRTYHLVNTNTGLTLCGLPTLPVRIRRKNGTGLTHTPTRPLDAILCKHCLRLSAPEDQSHA
jgi:hypothetical protein